MKSKNQELQFRLATIDDVELLTGFRMKLWDDVGKFSSEDEYNDIYQRNYNYLKSHFRNNKIVAPLFLKGKILVAMGIGVLIDKPVVNWDNLGLEGYIFNMYTESGFRKQGLATLILTEIFSYFKNRGVGKVCLNSNSNSFNLYKKFGMELDPYYQEIKLK